MAQVTIDIPNPIVSRVVDAICARNGYNGQGTKVAFAKQWLISKIKDEVKGYEIQAASAAAANATAADVDSLSIT